MKSFTNFKRDIRTFYKPKGKNSRRDNDQDIGNDTTGAQCADPGIQLASRPSTAAGPDEVQATPRSDSHTDPVEVVSTRAEAATDYHEPGDSSDCRASSEYLDPTTTSRSASAVEQSRVDDGTSLAESEQLEYQESIAEETELITFEEAQALRDQAYRTFACEEPEDFTDGPARIVVISDNVKRCAALLVPYDLSQKIQEALRGQHEFSRIELEGLFRRQSLIRLEDDVHREIFSCKARLCRLEDAGQMDTEDAQKLEQQMANLQLMLPDIGLRKQKASVDVDMHARRLRDQQAKVNAHLEEAFICAHLTVPHEKGPEPEIEKLDVSQITWSFVSDLKAPITMFSKMSSNLSTTTEATRKYRHLARKSKPDRLS